jgi:hypothetical protein
MLTQQETQKYLENFLRSLLKNIRHRNSHNEFLFLTTQELYDEFYIVFGTKVEVRNYIKYGEQYTDVCDGI